MQFVHELPDTPDVCKRVLAIVPVATSCLFPLVARSEPAAGPSKNTLVLVASRPDVVAFVKFCRAVHQFECAKFKSAVIVPDVVTGVEPMVSVEFVEHKQAFYCNGGKATDLCHAYSGQPICIFDYVRDAKEYVGYGVIEQLKNGILFSPKYESGLKRFDVPHVFVFANFLLEEGKFSGDRVKLFELNSIGQII